MRSIAVIFARGGSKGLPEKHLLSVAGTPLLGRVVRQALHEVEEVFVSTNDPRIASVAAEHGARVIDRPAALSRDDSRFSDAVFHAEETLRGRISYDVFVTLEGATIWLRPQFIGECLDCLVRAQAESAVTVIPCGSHHPDWSLELNDEGRVRYANERLPANRQDLRTAYFISGACRCTWRHSLERTAYSCPPGVWWDLPLDVAGFVVREEDFVHIENRRDLEWAEFLLQKTTSENHALSGASVR